MTDQERTQPPRGFTIRGLGEIAIRCDDVPAMAAFYGDVLGLERLGDTRPTGIVFFRIAEGVAGHTQVLALFDKGYVARPGLHPVAATAPVTGATSALHHIAFALPFAEQEAVIAHYEQLGLTYRVEHFGWVGWRGVFTQDPEGNTVELVAHHPDLQDP